MSSLSKYKKGWRLQVTALDGKRRTMYLPGGTSKKDAQTVQNMVDRMRSSRRMQQPFDEKTQGWLLAVDAGVRASLAKLGLVDAGDVHSERKTLAGWIDFYITPAHGHEPKSIRKLRDVGRKLVAFFGRERLLQDVTKGDAKRFVVNLEAPKADGGYGLSPSTTVPRHIGYCRQIFSGAIDDGLLGANPFRDRDLSATVQVGKREYVRREDHEKILATLPDLHWRLRASLMREMGLRPSELDLLRWSEVDWSVPSIIIHSPKTAHIPGKEKRVCGIFPGVMPLLREAFDAAPVGEEMILPSMLHKTLRQQYLAAMKRAAVQPWDALFNSLRKSAVTDAHDMLPSHVVDAWFGHSEAVSKKHYRMVTDTHFGLLRDKIKAADASVSHPASQQAPERSGGLPHNQDPFPPPSPAHSAGRGCQGNPSASLGIPPMGDIGPRMPM